MSALVLHVAHNARGALGFAFVATRKSGGYRGVASTAHRRSSRFFTEQIRSTQLTRRIRGYYCSMSAVSPEASPPSSINNTLRKEHQHEHQISSYYTSAELEKEFQIWDRLCDLEVPEGRVVGLNLRDFGPDDPDSLEPDTVTNNATGHWIYSLLHPDEVAYAIELPSKARRETFFIGRVAIREALERLGRNEPPTNNEANSNDHSLTNINSIPPIMKDEHGRPTMPKGYVGSISHKDRAGVGIVARDITFCSPDDPPKFGIGIDLERTTNKRRSIARRVLTENEIESLGQLEVRKCWGITLVGWLNDFLRHDPYRVVIFSMYLKDVTEEEEVMLRFR